MRLTHRTIATCLVAAATTGCNTPPDPRRTNFEIRGKEATAKYDPKTGKLKKIDVDQNKNGRMDTFSYWDGARVIRIEIDKDEDGKIDRWEHYGLDNKLESLGSSSKDDEVEDTWTYADKGGLLARVDTDTDRDGVVDKRESFVPKPGQADGRVLSMVEFGLDKEGKPSLRLHYRPNGELDRRETLRP